MKKVKHGNSRDVVRTLQTSRMESFATMFNGFVNYCCKAFHLVLCGGPGYTSGNSVTWTQCNRKKLQYPKSARGEECETKTLQGVKEQHEIVQNIKGYL